jgi:hypothetical protein
MKSLELKEVYHYPEDDEGCFGDYYKMELLVNGEVTKIGIVRMVNNATCVGMVITPR